MAIEDRMKTLLIIFWGTFCYKVFPLSLEGVGAMYQRAITTLFHYILHKKMEIYIDDMIPKSRAKEDHLTALQKIFVRLRKYDLKLNPNKCVFDASSCKLLSFI